MPTYEYRCRECDHQFEIFQSISVAPLTTCPVCGGKVERLISGGSGLIFKGSGFYITDYQSRGKNAKENGGKELPKSEDSKTKKSGESKKAD